MTINFPVNLSKLSAPALLELWSMLDLNRMALHEEARAKACATLHEIEVELYDRGARHNVRFLGFHSQPK
jgi:hypothetical protein